MLHHQWPVFSGFQEIYWRYFLYKLEQNEVPARLMIMNHIFNKIPLSSSMPRFLSTFSSRTVLASAVVLLSLGITNAVADDALPDLFEASYTLNRNSMEVGEVNVSLFQGDKGEFIYQSESKSTGLVALFYKLNILEQSRWQIVNKQLRSIEYDYHRIKKKKELKVNTRFDWPAMQATNIENDRKSTLPLEAGMLDKINYQVQIMRDLLSGRHPTTYTVIDSEKIKTYNFEYLGEKTIETPLGEFLTLNFSIQKPGDKRKSVIWCALEFDYLPIKIDSIEKDGEITTAIIDSYNKLDVGKNMQAAMGLP